MCGRRGGETASTTALCTAGVEPIVADSPMPFAPSGLSGLSVSVFDTSKLRQLGGRRHRVVHEVRGDRVAVVVVLHLLAQRLRGALRDAAVLLAGDEQRVEDRAAVVDRDVAEHSTSPVSVSTSTTAMCEPNGNDEPRAVEVELVREAARAPCPSGSLDGSFAATASSAHDSALAGNAGDLQRRRRR